MFEADPPSALAVLVSAPLLLPELPPVAVALAVELPWLLADPPSAEGSSISPPCADDLEDDPLAVLVPPSPAAPVETLPPFAFAGAMVLDFAEDLALPPSPVEGVFCWSIEPPFAYASPV